MADKTMKIFRITGRVINLKTQDGLTGLRVEAWDKGLILKDPVASAVTDAAGTFQIKLDASVLARLFPDRKPELFFKVFHDATLLKSTEDSVLWSANLGKTEIVIEVEFATTTQPAAEPAKAAFAVSGTVRRGDGRSAAGTLVRAYDQDLRKKQLLGKTVTDAEGRYKISYSPQKFLHAEKTSADLYVVVVDAKGKELASSVVIFNAPAEAAIDLSLPAEPERRSEFELLVNAIIPLLKSQGEGGKDLPLAELEEKDIAFLNQETGQPQERIAFLLAAAKAALATPSSSGANVKSYVSKSQGPAILVEVFYGWFRDGQLQDFSELIQRPVDELTASLVRAVQQAYIPALNPEQLKAIEKSLHQMRIDQVLQPAPDGKPASLGDLLNTISGDWLTDNRRKNVAVLLNTVNQESDDFLEKAKDAGFNDGEALQLRRTLRLSELTMKHAPMVKALQPFAANSQNDTITGLSAIETDRWLDFAYEYGVPPSSRITPEQYAQDLETVVESIVPTAVLVAKLQNGTIKLEQPGFESVPAVLKQHPTFDISSSDVDAFATDNSIDRDTALALGKLQNLKRTDARWEEVEVLVNTGLDSFARITQYSRDQFKTHLEKQIPNDRLDQIYDKVLAVQAVSIGMMCYLQPMFYGITPTVMQSHKANSEATDIIDQSPTLRRLFGALESCACDPCMSVLSPAAYLADLLKFIDASFGAGRTLRQRRSDIYDLELSCDNTQIELPHIDLAIEILENAVAFPYTISLPAGTDVLAELKSNPVGGAIRDALAKTATEPLGALSAQSDRWSLQPLIYIPGLSYWVVTDRYRRWVLKVTTAYFGLARDIFHRHEIMLNAQELGAAIKSLDEGGMPALVLTRLSPALANTVSEKLPAKIQIKSIKQIEHSRRWDLNFNWSCSVDLNLSTGLVTVSGPTSTLTCKYSTKLLQHIKQSLNAGMVPEMLSWFAGKESISGLTIQNAPAGSGWVINIPAVETLLFNPASLEIEGLSYQSTPSDRDLFVRPQNRNPLAYEKLAAANVCFPWSLPYDHALAETKETLRVAGISRLELLEVSSGSASRHTSYAIARERLGLSSEEWALIADQTRVTSNKVWSDWGLSVTSDAQNARLYDTYIDQEVEAPPLGVDGLLTRVSIILQQARLSFAELSELLQTDFINPDGAVRIELDSCCKPSDMRLHGVTGPHLDRLHRFVRLWRAAGWEVWEVDLALHSKGIGNKILDEDALVQIANLGLLKERFDLPVDMMVPMFGGFWNKRYSRVKDGAVRDIVPLYDRLFQDRRLADPPVEALAYSASVNTSVLPPKNDAGIAAALGLRATDLDALLESGDIDPLITGTILVAYHSLAWAFRNVTLARTLGLSLEDYASAWRLLGGAHFTSPATLLGFLDDIRFVQESGFSWSELEYILQSADADKSEHGLTTQQTAEVLSGLQRELRQLDAPSQVTAVVHFGLTEADLKTLPAVPSSPKERWGKRWGLTLIPGSTDYSVPDPDDTTKKLQGKPLVLLARLDVLAQQARLTPAEVKDVLQTVFVDPATPQQLAFTSEEVKNLTVEHLDRLDRFLALLRSSQLKSRELDLLLQAFCKTAADPREWILELKLVEPGTAVLTLRDRLQLPLDVIIGWWISGGGDREKLLADALGITTLDLRRLQAQFRTESITIPGATVWDSPMTLLAFVDASALLKQRAELVTQQLAQAVSLDPAFTSSLLWEHLHTSSSTPQPAIQLFIDPAFRDPAKSFPADSLGSSEEYSVLIRLQKFALLNSKWKANAQELAWLPSGEPSLSTFAGLSLNGLPTPNSPVEAGSIDWKRSTELMQLAHVMPATSHLISLYLYAFQHASAGKEAQDARSILKNPFGFAESSTTVDACATMLGITDPQHLDPIQLTNLVQLLGSIQRLGIEESQLTALTAEEPSQLTVDLGRRLLRPRFGDAGWQKALKEVSNALRLQQRDRLVDYVLTKEGHRDSNALYEHYLIDVEMSPCMNTTRMLQSTAAAQLFVQRCLFNLEKSVPPESIARDRWEWMQNYRVWEANRKVFLYPENWLFPEVRDDRTETFRAFESALTQNEPSYENAVKPLRQYLDDLVEVSQISVMGMYEHVEDLKKPDENGNPKYRRTLYLVGRSPNPPYTFYWRQALHYGQPGIRWTGWERIDQDLSGDHIVPFVFEGDLHIAWSLIKPIKEDNEVDYNYYEVQLAWARRTPTGWTKRKTSRDSLKVRKPFYRDERSLFAFKYVSRRDLATIECYVATPPTQTDDPPPFYYDEDGPAEAGKAKITLKPSIEEVQVYQDIEVEIEVRGWVRFKSKNNASSTSQPTIKYEQIKLQLFEGNSIGTSDVPMTERKLTISQPSFNSEIKIPFTVKPASDCLYYMYISNSGILFSVDLGRSNFAKSYDVIVDVVFEANVEADIYQISNETQLEMKSMGQFLFSPGSDGEWDPPNPVLSFTPPGKLYSWSSGLREPALGQSEGLPSVFSESNSPLFFALQANREDMVSSTPQKLWYVEEGTVRFFAKENPYQSEESLAVFPAGFGDSSTYKASAARSLDDLYTPLLQDAPVNTVFGIHNLGRYFPSHLPGKCDPRSVDLPAFDLRMPYANYNWEVFYHLPLAIAIFLSRQHRFEDAQRWLHFVFDPMTDDPSNGRERFWRFLPFRTAQLPDTITQILENLANPKSPHAAGIEQQVEAWLEDPFNPFAVARLRPSAFEWYTVVAYVKNLLAWADQMFRRDTRDSINQATLLYVMAAQILGPRPQEIRARGTSRQPLSYRAREDQWDDFSNTWSTLSESPLVKDWLWHGAKSHQMEQLASIGSLYFCVPPNEKLSELWDQVEDRLFKIRHCQNIEGVRRELALYEPPIDPELLIRAKAAGLDLADVLADRFAPIPYYRFQVLLQKANEFCNEVKSLGGAILSAIEKKEAEQLSLLRSNQEIAMLKLVESIKEEQIKEAQANITSLEKTKRNAIDRFAFLQRQLGKNQIAFDASGSPIVEQSLMTQVQETGTPDGFSSLSLIQSEIDQINHMELSNIFSVIAGVHRFSAGVTHLIGVYPAAKIAAEATGFALSATADGLSTLAGHMSFLERLSSQMGSWQRRRDEWVQQSKMTAEEIRQIDKQILALEIRKSIVEKELGNHRTQIEYASNIDDFMRHLKFSGESLYGWMESQLSGLYFSAYQVAYDLAKKAERAYQFELGDPSSSFVQFGHWDNLRKGLLSGERLSQNLRRMEAAHLERNQRELEITKHVSLRQLDPLALMQLRDTGECEFEIPEVLFDLDFPGHFFRRIKSVSISVPCVVGSYTSVSGTLTLLSSKLREKSLASGYGNQSNYRSSYLPIQSISTSTGQNDSGLFELNFRDERYLPFEGAGAISRWRFKLPKEFRAIDYETISDVILHIRYTARDGGETLQGEAVNNLEGFIKGAEAAGTVRLFSVRHDFPTEWAKFKGAEVDLNSNPNVFAGLMLHLEDKHYPYWGQGRLGAVKSAELYAKTSKSSVKIAEKSNGTGKEDTLSTRLGNLVTGPLTNNRPPSPAGELTLYFNDNKSIEDLWLALAWGK